LTSDFNEKLEDLRTELEQLRERLALEERDSKHLRDTLSEKEAILSTLKVELEDSKEEEARLRSRIEDLRDSSTLTEKQLIE
jgi:septal ring factor EnvC (AmiA/AmiB activator)